MTPESGWPQSGRKNSMSFPGFSRVINLNVNVIMTFIKGHDDPVYPVNSCFTQIIEWRTKILCLLQFSLRLHRIPWVFHAQRNPWVFEVFPVCGYPVNVESDCNCLKWRIGNSRFYARRRRKQKGCAVEQRAAKCRNSTLWRCLWLMFSHVCVDQVIDCFRKQITNYAQLLSL